MLMTEERCATWTVSAPIANNIVFASCYSGDPIEGYEDMEYLPIVDPITYGTSRFATMTVKDCSDAEIFNAVQVTFERFDRDSKPPVNTLVVYRIPEDIWDMSHWRIDGELHIRGVDHNVYTRGVGGDINATGFTNATVIEVYHKLQDIAESLYKKNR